MSDYSIKRFVFANIKNNESMLTRGESLNCKTTQPGILLYIFRINM